MYEKNTADKVDKYITDHKGKAFEQGSWNEVRNTIPADQQAEADRKVHEGVK